MDEPSRGRGTTQTRRMIYFGGREEETSHTNSNAATSSKTSRTNGKANSINSEGGKDIDETQDSSTSLEPNEILLQLNGDPCCSSSGGCSGGGNSTSGKDINGDSCTLSTTAVVLPRLEESDAKRQIELIFRTPACWRSETDQTHLLYLLERFPSLAAHNFDWDYNLFWEHGSEWSTPLCFLLASGAKLQTIEAVYSLNPEAIWKPQGVHRDLPLHFACRFGVAEDVLIFLIQKFPHAVVVSNSSGMLPIHCALGKKDVFPYGTFSHARLETIQILVDLYPQSLLKEEQVSHYTPLQIAFSHGYCFEAIDYIMSKLPERMEGFDLKAGCYHNKRFSVTFDRSESILVSKVLPRLQRFHCQPTEWKSEGLAQLLHCMQLNSSVINFKAMNVPSALLLEESVINSMSGLLRSNNTLESLGLSLQSKEKADTTSFFHFIEQSLQSNTCLQSLELDNFAVTCQGLNNFLSSCRAPAVIKMTNLALSQRNDSVISIWKHPNARNKVQQVILSGCEITEPKTVDNITHDDFLLLLGGMANMPRLQDFTLDTRKVLALDITLPLTHLLSQSRSLKTLRIRGLRADIKSVCKALQSNVALCRFDFPSLFDSKEKRGLLAETLENHNARIEFVQLRSSAGNTTEKETKKIRYLTRINQFGRGHLREFNTPKSLVVKLLQQFESQSRDFQPDEALSTRYGLLRECPSLWCNAESQNDGDGSRGRRRKRQRTF